MLNAVGFGNMRTVPSYWQLFRSLILFRKYLYSALKGNLLRDALSADLDGIKLMSLWTNAFNQLARLTTVYAERVTRGGPTHTCGTSQQIVVNSWHGRCWHGRSESLGQDTSIERRLPTVITDTGQCRRAVPHGGWWGASSSRRNTRSCQRRKGIRRRVSVDCRAPSGNGWGHSNAVQWAAAVVLHRDETVYTFRTADLTFCTAYSVYIGSTGSIQPDEPRWQANKIRLERAKSLADLPKRPSRTSCSRRNNSGLLSANKNIKILPVSRGIRSPLKWSIFPGLQYRPTFWNDHH